MRLTVIRITVTSGRGADSLRNIALVTRPLSSFAKPLPRSTVNRIKHGLGLVVASNLDALALLWGTDKARSHHGYTRHYANHLRSRRRSVECVLEIGIGDGADPRAGGSSLRMWRNYFPHATIYGIDLYEKVLDDGARITALQADQSDPSALRRAVAQCPPFDLIVDDGSHVGSHVITSFEVLFPKLAPGGYYAIEDLETSYLPAYGGGLPGVPDTAAALAKDLLDDLNLGSRPIAALHAYPGLVLVEKGEDVVPATPQPAAQRFL